MEAGVMLSLFNTVTATGNGKNTGTNAVDTTKVGSGGDTSGEDNKRLFNGSTALGKKRKKGRSAVATTAPAAKAAKIASPTTTKLEPIGITIPAPTPIPEEDKMVEIPNLDSPLFKDVPAKKDSSSDSSSSSGSSSSDDSSSSEEDSDDEESKKETTLPVNDVTPKSESPLAEPSKARTPIKLTISNVGKPSAKVTSSSSRDLLDSNSSDSEWDNEESDRKKFVNSETKEQYSTSKDASSPLRWKPVSLNPSSDIADNKLWGHSPTPLTDSNCNTHYEGIQSKYETEGSGVVKNSIMVAGMEIAMGKSDVFDSPVSPSLSNHVALPRMEIAMGKSDVFESPASPSLPYHVALPKNQKPDQESERCENVLEVKGYDEDSLLKGDEDLSIDPTLKHLDEEYLLKEEDENNVVNEFNSTKLNGEDIISDCDNAQRKVEVVPKGSSQINSHQVIDLDLAILSNSKDSKYCPDGFILAPTLSKSPEHLRSPLKYGSCYNGNLTLSGDNSDNPTDMKMEDNHDLQNSPSQNCLDTHLFESRKDQNDKTNVYFLTDANNEMDQNIPDKQQTSTKDDIECVDEKVNDDTECVDEKIKEEKDEDNCESETVLSVASSKDLENCDSVTTTAILSPTTTTTIDSTTTTTTIDSTTALKSSENLPVNQTTSSSPSECLPQSLPTEPLPMVTSQSPDKTEESESVISHADISSINSTLITDTTMDANMNQSSSPLPPPLSSLSSSSSSSSQSEPTTQADKTSMTPSSSSTTTSSSSASSSSSTTTTSIIKVLGCTNGIPDKENPFITWTKYDDDMSGTVDTGLPTSSLVQALARAPFPPLPIPGDAPGSQISPLHTSVPQLSPLGMAGISPAPQIPHLSSPGSQRVGMSPSHGSPGSSTNQSGRSSASLQELGKGGVDQQKPVQKSAKRSSRLSNIIDSLRSSKEKQTTPAPAATKEPPNQEHARRSALDALFGISHSVSTSASVTPSHPKSSSYSTSPAGSSICPPPPSSKDPTSTSDKLLQHQISTDTRQAIRSSLDAARAQAVNESFNALKDDWDKGKRMLENLELMKNGLLDSPYGKQPLISDQKPRRIESSSSSQLNRGRTPSSTPTTAPSSSSSSSSLPRPSSRQSSKLPNNSQTHSSSSSSSLPSASKSSSVPNTLGNSLSNNMFQAAPSAALTAAHMELNAAAANIMAFQHLYGMQDPYLMKTLMSNPLYLQRMMEFQKQAMDPMMLRQLELLEAAAIADKSKNSKDQRAAVNAQNLLWSAQAATMLQHQQMQQLQQIQLHHQQQMQQQAVAAKEKESLDTIAALMANKSNNFHNSHKSINSGSISTGQSSKFVAPSSSTPPSTSNKRPRSNATPTLPSNSYSRDILSAEKKARLHSSQSNTPSGYSTSSLSSSTANRVSHSSHSSSKPTSTSSSSSSSRSLYPTTKQDYHDLQAQLSASAAAGLWGFPPGMVPQQHMDMARMSRYFEQQQQQHQQQHHQQQQQQQQRPSDRPSSSSAAAQAEPEASGAEVLDLSVKPRTGKA